MMVAQSVTDESRPVTANHVLTALAILGWSTTGLFAPTDRDLPQLLGALLYVVESEIAGLPSRHDRAATDGPTPAVHAVLDGFRALADRGGDRAGPLELAARRLDRTAAQLRRATEQCPAPAGPILDVAQQASRCASIALTAHLIAVDGPALRPEDGHLQAQLMALETAVTDVIDRFDGMVRDLHHHAVGE
jgi:hypothetical protein